MTRAEALRLYLLLHYDNDAEAALTYACEQWVQEADASSWGFARPHSSAYAGHSVIPPKPRVAPLDVAQEQPPHG